MTTTVQDFGSPEVAAASLEPPRQRHTHASSRSPTISRSATVPRSSTVSRSPTAIRLPDPAMPRSPTVRDDPEGDRRGSVLTRASTWSSTEGGMRHRRPDRSNTITSYHQPEQPNWQPGAEPGIDTSAASEVLPPHLATVRADCDINIFDFSVDEVRHAKTNNAGLSDWLDEPRPADLPCRWISVNGLSWDVIRCLGNKYSLHRLAIEDLIHTHTRTKVDWYADHAFVVMTLQKLVRLHQHKGQEGKCDCAAVVPQHDMDEKLELERSDSSRSRQSWWQRRFSRGQDQGILPRYLDQNMDGKIDEFVQAHSGVSEDTPIKPIRTLHRYESAQIPEHTAFMEKHSVLAEEDLAVSVEQVSMFLLTDNTVISFFEHSADDVEIPIVDRLQSPATMLRRSCDASLLLQAIIDTIVDLAVPVKDAYNKARKELQIDAMTNPDIKTSRALHIFGEEIDMLQNLFKPIVHLVNALRDHNSEPLMPTPPTVIRHIQEDDTDDDAERKRDPIKAKRDREGAPMFNRRISGFRRTAKRPETATSVAITPLAHTYFGDVLDHCITMIQTFEQMDASAGNISSLIFNTVGAKTNGFMMILAIVTVFFAPLTFISGYFGMNFSSGNGLAHPFAFFWVVAVPSLVAFMIVVFATMLWDNVETFMAKRGIRAHRRNRRRRT